MINTIIFDIGNVLLDFDYMIFRAFCQHKNSKYLSGSIYYCIRNILICTERYDRLMILNLNSEVQNEKNCM